MEYNAKLTDWIPSINMIPQYIYLITSKKLTDIILEFNFPKEVQFFDAKIMWRKKIYDYNCLYSSNKSFSLVDFKKTLFNMVAVLGGEPLSTLQIKNGIEHQEAMMYGLNCSEEHLFKIKYRSGYF